MQYAKISKISRQANCNFEIKFCHGARLAAFLKRPSKKEYPAKNKA